MDDNDGLKDKKIKELLFKVVQKAQEEQSQKALRRYESEVYSPVSRKDGEEILRLDLDKAWLWSKIDSVLWKSKIGHKIEVAERVKEYVSLVRDIQGILYEINAGKIRYNQIELQEKVLQARMVEDIVLSKVGGELAWLSVEDKKLDVERKRAELDPAGVFGLTKERDRLRIQKEIDEIQSSIHKSTLELETEIEKLKRTKEKYVKVE